MFDRIIVWTVLYDAKVFNWTECQEMQIVRIKYIKWCLDLKRCALNYIVSVEIRRDRARIVTGIKAMVYGSNIRQSDGSWKDGGY